MNFITEPPVAEFDAMQGHWNLVYDKIKYQMMWALRHLEKEIVAEGGTLTLFDKNGSPTLQYQDFSPVLTEKIRNALDNLILE